MKIPPLYLFHPIAVHFPIALLSIGFFAAFLAGLLRKRAAFTWIDDAASWLLWLGTLGAWAAMGLGLLAEDKAPHVPEAWEVLSDHKTHAFWTVGVFSVLSIWRIFRKKDFKPQLIAWALCLGLLLSTAYLGGRLVFDFGMGVVKVGWSG